MCLGNNANISFSHAVFIIGNKKQLDMKQLSRYGRIVELKEKDIIR